MLLRIARWLFQLPGRLFGRIFNSRLTLFIFFMLIAVGIFGTKRYLRAQQQQDELTSAAPAHYDIKRGLPLREAREQCGGPLHDNDGQPWPAVAGYIHQPERPAGSRSQRITLENQRNDFAVLVKLETPEHPHQLAEVFIPAAASFAVNVSAAGKYVLKIRDIKSGCSFRSQPFPLAVEHNWRLPLSLHGHGEVEYQAISASEF
ncbi:hypothetical protein [Serratia sp. AKBS12]|uniref:hypothetical protein n=1 Tax=Serratia sp. AKBS12 TaxID=2974597 RepID=UPI00216526CD|nr:hypothetical protein [Serratia sp. AKBS12]MCS3409864.1 hypothetical protein [Serratia sp. AKBS12]HEI8867328.1 hypothetical protein [Serratia odorifera]